MICKRKMKLKTNWNMTITSTVTTSLSRSAPFLALFMTAELTLFIAARSISTRTLPRKSEMIPKTNIITQTGPLSHNIETRRASPNTIEGMTEEMYATESEEAEA